MVPIVDEVRTNDSTGQVGAVLDASEAWQAIYAAPEFDLDPLTGRELDRLFRGEAEADLCERMLAAAARVRGALDVEFAVRLDVLR